MTCIKQLGITSLSAVDPGTPPLDEVPGFEPDPPLLPGAVLFTNEGAGS
jgi:hypothetical protein